MAVNLQTIIQAAPLKGFTGSKGDIGFTGSAGTGGGSGEILYSENYNLDSLGGANTFQISPSYTSPMNRINGFEINGSDLNLSKVIDKSQLNNQRLELTIDDNLGNTAKYAIESIYYDIDPTGIIGPGGGTSNTWSIGFASFWGERSSINKLIISAFGGGLTTIDESAENEYIEAALNDPSLFIYFTIYGDSIVEPKTRSELYSFAKKVIENVLYDSGTRVDDLETIKTRFYEQYDSLISDLGSLYSQLYFEANPGEITVNDFQGSISGQFAEFFFSIDTTYSGDWNWGDNYFINSGGENYSVDEVLTSPSWPTLEITVTEVDEFGGIISASITGIVPEITFFPENSLQGGTYQVGNNPGLSSIGNDHYNGPGNRIYTEFDTESPKRYEGPIPYGSGLLVDGATSETYFGINSSYLSVYKDSVFGMFVKNPKISKFIVNGEIGSSGEAGDGVAIKGFLGPTNYQVFLTNKTTNLVPFVEENQYTLSLQDDGFSVTGLSITTTPKSIYQSGSNDFLDIGPIDRTRNMRLSAMRNIVIKPRRDLLLEGGNGSGYDQDNGNDVIIRGGNGADEDYQRDYQIDNDRSRSGTGGDITLNAGSGGLRGVISNATFTQGNPTVLTIDAGEIVFPEVIQINIDTGDAAWGYLFANTRSGKVFTTGITETTYELFYDQSRVIPIDSSTISGNSATGTVTSSRNPGEIIIGQNTDRIKIGTSYWPILPPNDGDQLVYDSTGFRLKWVPSIPLGVAPATSIGSDGDVLGTVAFDSEYNYYCSANYDGVTDIWKRTAWSANTW